MRAPLETSGFTLIEIIIALFIFSIIAMLIITGLSNVLNSRDAIAKHNERLAELQIAMSVISRDVEQIINAPIMDNLNKRLPAFMEESKSGSQVIEFSRAGYINPRAVNARSSLQRVSYFLKNSALYRQTWSQLNRNQDHPASSSTRKLLSNIKTIQWHFIDSNNKSYTYWPPTNFQTFELPKAMVLTLHLKDWGEVERFFLLAERKIEITKT